MSTWTPPVDAPLKRVARCKRTECEKQLHCFLKDKRRRTKDGTCIDCGADIINWARLHSLDICDLDNTVAALKNEHIRHEFWCSLPLSNKALRFAHKLGRVGLYQKALSRVKQKLANPGIFADWGQVPFEDKGDAIHFAQHATATCCRRCIEVWYGIPRDQILSDTHIEYFATLILRYVTDRMPDLDEGSLAEAGMPVSNEPHSEIHYGDRS